MGNCKVCDKVIVQSPNPIKLKTKYCSKECLTKSLNERMEYIKLINKKRVQSLGILNCKECNNEFIPKVFHQKFCNNMCLSNYTKKGGYKKYLPKNYTTTRCKSCNNIFLKNNSRFIFCSPNCSKDYKKKKGMTNDIHLISVKDTFKQFKKQYYNFYDCYYYDLDNFGGNRIWCLIRDNFSCKKCGSNKNLTIHHLDGKGFAVNPNKRNNQLDNLITLCNLCHNTFENEILKIENYIHTPSINSFIYKIDYKINADMIVSLIQTLPKEHQDDILSKMN